ncbi:MAG: class I SAM-dependent methyltransferase, partial [Thermoproteota archaeon]|nr:class I SAM-dependent methyltransferase [Thermoproteota archaeon]
MHGGSIELWKKYFGGKVHIYSIDINPECKTLEGENSTIFIGSQSNPEFLKEVLEKLPELDIIIDDGGHTMIQQKVSFEILYLKVKEGGLYMVEDTHTSYWKEYHGGLKNPNSFIEYSKNIIDSLYEGHVSNKKKLLINDITKHIHCICFYDSMIVFEKQKRNSPFHIRKGAETITPYRQIELKRNSILMRIKSKLFGKKVNTIDINDRGKL